MAPTAGYSGKPLAAKLGIVPGCRLSLIGAPKEFVLGALPEAVDPAGTTRREVDIVLLFVRSRSQLARAFARQTSRLVPRGMLWVAWPKKASGVVTDMTEDRVREVALPAGWVDVKVCAVDAVWSGLKLVRRLPRKA